MSEKYTFTKIPIYSKVEADPYCINQEEAKQWHVSEPILKYQPRVLINPAQRLPLSQLLKDIEWILFQIYRKSGHGFLTLNCFYIKNKEQHQFEIIWHPSHRALTALQ